MATPALINPRTGLALALLLVGPALAGPPNGMNSIEIEPRAGTPDARPPAVDSERERAYWQCVLEHVKGVQSDQAVQVIQAGCRALHGSNRPPRPAKP